MSLNASLLINRIDRPIALVGLMGSGKSMLGRRLAAKLHLPFADTDILVEELAGISIRDIFDIAGEEKFRDLERRAIETAVQNGPAILSTGGGTMCNDAAATLITGTTIAVWLAAEPKTLLARIGSTKSRPMLDGGNPLAALQKLARTRQKFYSQAHIHLKTDSLSTAEAFSALLDALDRNLPLK